MLRHCVAIGSLLFATGVAAEPSALSGDAIRETVAGAVFEVDTPLGAKLPVHYSEDGRLRGEARELAYMLGSQSDIGRWWVVSDRLCQKWVRWFDGAIHCLRLSQDGSRIFWRRDDGETGTASIVTPSRSVARIPNSADQLRAREAPESDAAPSSSLASTAVAPQAEAPKTAPASDIPLRSSVGASPALNRRSAKAKEVADNPRLVKPAGEARPVNAARATRSVEPNRANPVRPIQSFTVAGVALHDVLNVRDGPSAEYAITGAIPPNTEGVRIVGQCVSDWCPISHRGITGWVNSMYLIKDTTIRGLERAQHGIGPNYRP